MNRRRFLTTALCAALPAAGLAAAPEGYTVPAHHMPRLVRLATPLPPFEIRVDPADYALYWTQPDGRALRYTVGIGRGDLYESGVFRVGAKKEWPSWTPTDAMIEREPHLYERWADGMPGGPTNPLGARALYLFTPAGGDSFLRIHGTPEAHTVGRAVSNGCVRLINSHAIHLYHMVPLGTRVVLL